MMPGGGIPALVLARAVTRDADGVMRLANWIAARDGIEAGPFRVVSEETTMLANCTKVLTVWSQLDDADD